MCICAYLKICIILKFICICTHVCAQVCVYAYDMHTTSHNRVPSTARCFKSSAIFFKINVKCVQNHLK